MPSFLPHACPPAPGRLERPGANGRAVGGARGVSVLISRSYLFLGQSGSVKGFEASSGGENIGWWRAFGRKFNNILELEMVFHRSYIKVILLTKKFF